MSVDQAHGLRVLLSSQPQPRRPARARGRLLAVMSGKGGVGKTQVSVCLAVVAARRGQHTLVIDGDAGLANADIMLGARPRHTLEDVLACRCSAAEAIARGTEGVSLLTAGSGDSWITRAGAHARSALRSELAGLVAEFDVVIIDCGAGIGEGVVFLGGLAEERVIVVTPEPTALVDAYAMAKAISDAGHRSVDVVVNCALTHTEAESCFGKLAAVAGRFLPLELRFAGIIPRDDAVRRAVMGRRPVVVDAPAARASQAFVRLEHSLREGARSEVASVGLP